MNTQENTKVGFRDVKRDVLERIHTQFWAPGALLPTETELAGEYGCARATISRAMRELSEEGIVDRRRKVGTRVRLSPIRHARFEIPIVRTEIEASGAVYRYSLVKRKILTAPDWLRARLALPQGAKVLHLHCMYYSNGAPFLFEDRWINLAVVPQAKTVDFAELSPNEWLVREVPFTDAEIQFSATAATETLAEFLLMSPGEPVLTSDRTTWLAGRPVTNTRLYFMRGYRMVTQV